IEIRSSPVSCRIGNRTDSCRIGTTWTAYCTARLDEQIEWYLDQEFYYHERINISEQVRAQNCERKKCLRRISQWRNSSDNTFVSKLEIDELDRSDFGDYHCQVLNHSSERYRLQHRGLHLIPRTTEARLNENFVFVCKASGVAEANDSIEWFMKHKCPLHSSIPLLPYYSNDFEIKTWEVYEQYTSELRITRLTPRFLGFFWCTIEQLRSSRFELQLKNTTEETDFCDTNNFMCDDNKTRIPNHLIMDNKKDCPDNEDENPALIQFETRSSKISAVIGSSYTAHCISRLDHQIEWAHFTPYPKIEWKSVSEQVRTQNCEKNEKCPRRISQWKNASDNSFVSKLEIDELEHSDFGHYYCKSLRFYSENILLDETNLTLQRGYSDLSTLDLFLVLDCIFHYGQESDQSIQWFINGVNLNEIPAGRTERERFLPKSVTDYYINDDNKTRRKQRVSTSRLMVIKHTPYLVGTFWCATKHLESSHFETDFSERSVDPIPCRGLLECKNNVGFRVDFDTPIPDPQHTCR
ncbi:hypothetical protein ElyMa_006578100, partial [Elysia marginata]